MKHLIGFISALLISCVIYVPIFYFLNNFLIAYIIYMIVFWLCLPIVNWLESIILAGLGLEED